MRLEITGHALTPERFHAAAMAGAEAGVRGAMFAVERELKSHLPSKTGHLRRSVAVSVRRSGNQVIGEIGTDLPYARYLEEGTGLYGPRNRLIVPTRAQALRFPEPGNRGFTLAGRVRSGTAGGDARFVFAKSVKGIRPRRFFADANVRAQGAVARAFEQSVRVVERHLARGR